jgi:hypothetical protein
MCAAPDTFFTLARKWLYEWSVYQPTTQTMLFQLFFKQWPLHKKISYFQKNGVLIGSRVKDSRKIFIYMYQNHFAEVLFKSDNPEGDVESANIVKGLQNLNNHLEKDFKTTF